MNTMEKDPGWQFLRLSREKLLAEQNRPYDSKKNVWIPDAEDGYAAGEVTSTKGDTVVLTVKGAEKTVKKDVIQEMNPPKYEKTEDMSNLTFLNDASVLYNLRARYAAMLIYTYSGLFCVVINPYKRLPIYTDSVARMFMGKRRTEMPPHLFAVSDEAYRNMLQNKENQSMLITGESGAGKTENTKKVIAYFASVGASQNEGKADLPKVTLEDQIVQTNPVLEAFGNAKTVRNNNSSRFGKFIRIHFNRAGRVASCDIEHYLLEKSRVVRQAPGERCYHIFYQIFSGFIPDLKKRLKLDKPLKDYWFVAQAELTIDGIDDVEEFKLTDEAFTVLNFSPEEKNDCYRLMAGIMHMGNMKFKQRPREEQAEPEETEEAQCAAEMFGIETDPFLNSLVKPRVRVGNEWVSKGQSVEQVNWAIGAMAKGLYARVFDWLVKKCNMTLDQKGLSRDSFIGVLDIAGFEIFDFNSFEQLWINFVNERLQQFFNHHMFVLEQEEYAREGIQWTFIDFGLDLQACIELIEKPMGIISMLDEECIVPKATDLTLAQKLLEQHLGKHPNFEKPKPPKGKQAEAHFAMRHYAGTVRYNVTNWLEKNKDPLNDTLISIMKAGKSNALILEVWANYQTQEEAAVASKSGGGGKKKGKSGSFMTVSMLYRESLNKLMTMLHKTHPHFIRCIIPNEKKQSGMIDAALVLNQLTCNGVLEGIRICRKGFPNRSFHKDFRARYSLLAADEAREAPDDKTAAANILNKLIDNKELTPEQFKVGHTKVFFKSGVLASIEELRDVRQNELMTNLQAVFRWYLARCFVKKKHEQEFSYYYLQKNIRVWTVLRTWDWYKLFVKVKPMMGGNKYAEDMERLEVELKETEAKLIKEEEARKAAEAEHAKITESRKKLLEEMNLVKSGGSAVEEQVSAVSAAKVELERRLGDLKDRLTEQQQRAEEAQRQVKRAEKDRENLSEQIGVLDESLARVEEEKKAAETRIRDMHETMAKQDEEIGQLNREKKRNEEENRKLAENIQAETEKSGQSNRVKAKLEHAIEDIEDSLDRERRHRVEVEKARKKLESELLLTQEQIDENNKHKHEVEGRHRAVEEKLSELATALEIQTVQSGKTQRQLKEQSARIIELEEELEGERHARAKTDKSRGAIQAQLDELNESIDDQSGKTSAQVELNKKKDLELMRLRQELEELNQRNEAQLSNHRKKNTDELAELNDRLDAIQKAKAKSDKDRELVRRQLDDVTVQIQEESKTRAEKERLAKSFESQVQDLQNKSDEQHKLIQDLAATKSRFQVENADAEQSLEELENRLTQVSKSKAQALAQLEDAKRTVEEEHHERQEFSGICKNLEHDLEQIREAIDEESHQKEEVLKQLSKARAECQQWKTRFEGEGLVAVDEMEEDRRRRMAKKLDIQDALSEVNTKLVIIEKANSKLLMEVEEAHSDVERNRMLMNQLDKKQAASDKIIDDWHRQCDELTIEIEKTQNEARRSTADVYSLQTASTSLSEQADELRRDNKMLSNEVKDLNEQLGSSGRNAHDVAKKVRALELEKEELQHALDEAESALEIEETNVMRVQAEVAQIRADIDRRIHEKEEDFENTLKNHQHAIESIRASLEVESKAKNSLLQSKKKLETDINDLELNLDMANKTNVEAQKNIKKMISQIQELQLQVEEEQRRREECRENYLTSERKLAIVLSEMRELEAQREQLDMQKRKVELAVTEQRAQKTENEAENVSLTAARRSLENDLQLTKSELDKSLSELKQAEENFKKVSADLTRLTEELRQEQQHRDYVERQRKANEMQIKELQLRLEQTESQSQKLGQKAVDNLQQLIRTREHELDLETKRHKEVIKQLNKCEREVRERKFELDEHKKSSAKMQELIEKLQQKIKTHKKQIEEAEEVSALNLQKYRQIQTALEQTEERADEAENSLVRMKSKIRTNGLGASSGGLRRNESSAAVMLNGDLANHHSKKRTSLSSDH